LIELGKIVHRFRKSRSDDLVISISEYDRKTYVNLSLLRERPDYEQEKGTMRAYITFDFRFLPDFLEGIEKLKEAAELVKKGASL